MTLVKIAYNATTAKLIDSPKEIKSLVSEMLSYSVSGAEYSSTYKAGNWDGRSSFFKYRQATFPAGFVDQIVNRLKRDGHRVQRIAKLLPKPLGSTRPNINAFGYTDEYSYQPETVDKLISKGRMIAQIATGGGKSNICCIAIARIKRPALFITTRGALMYQMKATLEESLAYRSKHGEPELKKAKVGVVGDGVWEPRKTVTVAMIQTLAARLKDPDPFSTKREQIRQKLIQEATKKLLSKFEVVILEEAHEASGDSYFNVLANCRNAYYRLALTATPFMKDDIEDNMRLMACAGGIGMKVTEKELIDKGILAKPFFKYIDNPKSVKLFRTTSWQRAYKLGITECIDRNDLVVQETIKMTLYGLSVMILVQHTGHGEALKKMLTDKGLRVRFLRGSVKQIERQHHLKELETGKINVLIGTNVLDVGVDVPSVGGIILGGGGKAEVALRQRIGRGLRRKKVGPNVAFIVDFVDRHNTHTREHAAQRRYIVENTEGFGERILSKGSEFNYSLFN